MTEKTSQEKLSAFAAKIAMSRHECSVLDRLRPTAYLSVLAGEDHAYLVQLARFTGDLDELQEHLTGQLSPKIQFLSGVEVGGAASVLRQ